MILADESILDYEPIEAVIDRELYVNCFPTILQSKSDASVQHPVRYIRAIQLDWWGMGFENTTLWIISFFYPKSKLNVFLLIYEKPRIMSGLMDEK